MKYFDIINIAFTILMIVLLSIIAWDGIEQVSWKDKCKDAGGIPASNYVCVNPGAVIEVI